MSSDHACLPGSKAEPARSSRPATSPIAQDKHLHRETSTLSFIVGPNGDIITLADLPSPHMTRWVIRRKAEIVLAVHGGLLTLDEACKRYQLTAEEFDGWQTAIEQHGLLGLRATHVRDHRHGDKS